MNQSEPSDTAAELRKSLLKTCIVGAPQEAQGWDEMLLLGDQPLLANLGQWGAGKLYSAGYLKRKPNLTICALGRSGLSFGAALAQSSGSPLIWYDREKRIVPASRKLANTEVVIVDSVTVFRWAAAGAALFLRHAGARLVRFIVLVDCDIFPEEQREPLGDEIKLVRLVSLTEHWKDIASNLAVPEDELRHSMEEPAFWRRAQ